MYLFIELYGTKKEQQMWHCNLREPLMNLSDMGRISRFVLTYHSKPKNPERARLYLSMDIPDLTECTLEALLKINGLKKVSDYIAQLRSEIKMRISDYEAIVEDGIQVNNASKGSAAALKILKEGPKALKSLNKLVKKVIDYCGGLVDSWEDPAHFCFNSLGLNLIEEKIARSSYLNRPIPSQFHSMRDDIILNLFERESWEIHG